MTLKIVFSGTPEWAAQCLEALIDSPHHVCAVLTQPDKPAGRGQKLCTSPVQQVTQRHPIALYQPTTLKSVEIQRILKELNPDIIINVAYGLFFPQAILDIPRLGCINIHPSLLPRWRGASPIISAVLTGDQETGISIMKMDAGWDTGPVLVQKRCSIDPDETTLELQQKLTTLAIPTLFEALDKIENGSAQWKQQDDTQALYCQKIQKSDAEIDWQKPALEIHRAIRAFNPWPITWTTLADQTIRIFKASLLEATQDNALPGTILRLDKKGIEVMTGKGILRIEQAQFPGGKPLLVQDILNSKKEFFLKHHCFESNTISRH